MGDTGTDVDEKEGKHLQLVAGVFLDPETQLMEVQPGAEGINPYAVIAGALYNFAKQALQLAQGVVPMEGAGSPQKPQILRARGPLPPGMKRP